MPLSRLENFLKNTQGTVLYVAPEELDATDDITNTGNSRTRPFRTIQRALIEAARFSYRIGKDNDRFDRTTIMVSPGLHYIDNRPGLKIDTNGTITDVNGSSSIIDQFSINSNFDIQDISNELYKFNSAEGGVIIPRGTSIIGQDLRKTKIRPKYVPDPKNNNIDKAPIFRVTGACFFFGFTFFDANPNDRIYKDYTTNLFTPNFSHHKLTCFEYADGKNNMDGQNNTDLQMYYNKLTLAFGTNSGRALPNYPASTDFEMSIDETRIVGAISQVGAVEIEDIYSGTTPTATVATPVVTVVTKTDHNLSVNTPISITGLDNSEYDGIYFVSQVLSDSSFTYSLPATPTSTANPSLINKSPKVTIESDTVTSASPYIFNCSIRSVFGMNGMHCDGAKATGFKSMVVAQFTGVALNKDDDAYVKYNPVSGNWEDKAALGTAVNLHTDSLSKHKPDWQNTHIKVSNDGIIQAVSVFAIGYAKHFEAKSGGDMSITNSNSNFGAKSLEADSFRRDAFTKDDFGYITSIVPPKRIFSRKRNVNWLELDVDNTVGLSTDIKVYLYGYTERDTIPDDTSGEYHVGASTEETLGVLIEGTEYTSRVLMPVPGDEPDDRIVGKKSYLVGRSAGINSITGSVLNLEEDHRLLPGESVRIFSDDGSLPDGLEYDKKYYAITDQLNNDQIKLATTYNNAITGVNISGINNIGGKLEVISSVSDKEPGDPGHPIQYDDIGWYINVDAGNNLSEGISDNQADITPKTAPSFVRRFSDTRDDNEKIYRFRYVVPQTSPLAAPPSIGFSVIDSNSEPDDDNFQNLNQQLSSVDNLRTRNEILDASWSSTNIGIITTGQPHHLKADNIIRINRLKSENNNSGEDDLGFNGIFSILSITNETTFTIGLNTNPGGINTIANNLPYTMHDRDVVGSGRTFMPYFSKKYLNEEFSINDKEEVQELRPLIQDGVYNLRLASYNNRPTVAPFDVVENQFPQDFEDVYPTTDVDNPLSDPPAASSYALRDDIGVVKTNRREYSTSKEGLNNFLQSFGVGIGITASSINGRQVTLNTLEDHGYNGARRTNITSGGSGYGRVPGQEENYYNVRMVGGSGKGYTADITINSSGQVSDLVPNHPGSGYSANDVVSPDGLPQAVGGTAATIQIVDVWTGVGECIECVGVGSTGYNGIHRITEVPSSKELRFTLDVLDNINTPSGFFYKVGASSTISSIDIDPKSGIATVFTEADIGLRRGDQLVIEGYSGASEVFNGSHFVTERIGYGVSIMVDFGPMDSKPFISGVGTAKPSGLSAQASGNPKFINDGYTGYLQSGINTTQTLVDVPADRMLERGQYIRVENEIMRVANRDGTQFIRGALGTNPVPHERKVHVERIRVIPVENRRYSILRASGHTFEYVGFGPGNYSTAMPQVQDRILTLDETRVSQSLRTRGGFVVYSGMNDQGDFYISNVKVSNRDGKLVFGEDVDVQSTVNLPSIVTFDQVTVNDKFYSNGDADFIDIKLTGNRGGTINKAVYVGIINNTVPTSNQDTILYRTSYESGGFMGYVKTSDSSDKWKKFGLISESSTDENYSVDRLGIGNGTDSNFALKITGDSRFIGDISHSGDYNLTGDITQTGDLTRTGNTTNNGTFSNVGSHSISGDSTLNGDFTQTGNATRTGTLSNNGNVSITGTLSVSSNTSIGGNASIAGNLDVDGATTLDGTTIDGDLDLNGSADIQNDLDVGGNISANGNGSFGGSLGAGQATFTGLSVANNISAGGNGSFTGSLSAASASISGQVSAGSVDTDTLRSLTVPSGSGTIAKLSDIPAELTGGDGISVSNGTISINAGNGLRTNGNTILMRQPNSITATSTNTADNTGHTHRIANGTITSVMLTGAQSGSAPIFGIRAWGRVNGSSGSLTYGGNISSTQRTGTGTYRVDLLLGPGDNNFTVVATPESDDDMIYVTNRSTNSFTVQIRSDGGDTQNHPFHFIVIW